MTPDLSVVLVASWSAGAVAQAVLTLCNKGVEVIVTSASDRVPSQGLPTDIPWIVGRTGDGVPELRRLGAQASTGRVVAFLEDACIPTSGWVEAIREGFVSGNIQAATGPVEPSWQSGEIDWAVYFAEYAPFAASQDHRLAGPNFACLRTIIDLTRPVQEYEIALKVAKPAWLPKASVLHIRRYTKNEAIRDRYDFGRRFGQERWGFRSSPLTRLGHWAAPAILVVQLARLAKALLRSPRLIRPFLKSARSTLVLLISWSMGEAAGWSASRRIASRRCETTGRRHALASDLANSRPADCGPGPDLV